MNERMRQFRVRRGCKMAHSWRYLAKYGRFTTAYCTTTDTPPFTLDSMKAAIAAMEKLGPPPTPTGPGSDLQLSRDVFDFLLSMSKGLDCGIPHMLGATPLSLSCGLGIQVNDLLPDGTVVGLTEAGRELVKDMKLKEKP